MDVPPRLLVVSCGGTISSLPSGDVGATPRLDADELVAGVPELAELARVSTHAFSLLPSAHLTLTDVLALRTTLLDALEAATDDDDPVAAIVVTQGTDTLEEVAFALDLVWDSPVPVVLTGAMRNPGLAGPDGAANVLGAAVTGLASRASGLGVLVVMNDGIHLARYVRKLHTTDVAAFASPTLGPIGYVAEGVARIALVPADRRPPLTVPESFDDGCVAVVTQSLGDDDRLLAAVLAGGFAGLVIEGVGGGHVTGRVAASPVLDELIAAMPVVIASRAPGGPTLRTTYDYPGSEVDLLARGVIGAGELDARKARILLTFLLASGASLPQIATAFGSSR